MENFNNIFKKYTAVMLLLFTVMTLNISCQEDKVIIQNPPPDETIEPGSDLVILMQEMAGNDVRTDNIIDDTSCSSIQFPFTVVAGGIEVIIDSVDDLLVIEQLIDNANGNIDIEILFPITIILPDYATIVIENQEAFDLFIASCDPAPNECVNFVYPISFSVFNLEFELIETIVIENDFDLFFFLQDVNDNNGNIISLNFPVTLIYDNGTTIEVNTNTELAAAIEAGPENCEDVIDPDPDPNNECPAALVESYLLECFWYPQSYNGTQEYEFYHFTFSNGEQLNMTTPNAFSIDALWNVEELNDKTILLLEANFPIFEPFLGNWEVLECTEDEFLLEREDGIQMTFTRNCGPNFAECYGSGQGICDDDLDGFVPVDIGALVNNANCNDSLEYIISFYETSVDAYNGTNQLPPAIYNTITPGSQVLYYAVRDINNNELLYVGEFEIIAEDCGGSGCENPGILTDGLIVYIPFGNEVRDLITDEELPYGGQLVADRSGNANCAIGFSEGDDPVYIPGTTDNELTTDGDFTISLWFKMQNDVAGDYEVMFRTQLPGAGGMALAVYDLNTPLFSTENDPQVNLWDNDWNQEVDVEWTNTDWHHLVITHQDNVTFMYRDGVLRNESQTDIDLGLAAQAGYQLNAISSTGNFVGHLDDFRLYNRGLTEDEVLELFTLEADCYNCLD